MCLQTVEDKLNRNQYKSASDCIEDIQLIFDNCRAYNPVSFLNVLINLKSFVIFYRYINTKDKNYKNLDK